MIESQCTVELVIAPTVAEITTAAAIASSNIAKTVEEFRLILPQMMQIVDEQASLYADEVRKREADCLSVAKSLKGIKCKK